jgi:hypothetical protein
MSPWCWDVPHWFGRYRLQAESSGSAAGFWTTERKGARCCAVAAAGLSASLLGAVPVGARWGAAGVSTGAFSRRFWLDLVGCRITEAASIALWGFSRWHCQGMRKSLVRWGCRTASVPAILVFGLKVQAAC